MIRARCLCALVVALTLGGPSALAQLTSPDSGGSADPEAARGNDACLRDPVEIHRAHSRPLEAERLSLTHCDGRPNLDALVPLSVLGRPNRMDRPAEESVRSAMNEDGEVAPGVIALDPGLLSRLQQISDRFPERAIEIVSGHRPRSRRTSRHHGGHALDIAVVDVDRREVARFARQQLEASGVGYYPNSTFTHIDVRRESYAWKDLSRPGQRSRYRPWPAPANESGEEEPPAVAEAPPTPIVEPPDAAIDWEPPFESRATPADAESTDALEERQITRILQDARSAATELSESIAALGERP